MNRCISLTALCLVGLLLVLDFQISLAQSAQQSMNLAGQAANSNKRPGQPVFGVNGGGSGQNRRNWGAGGNIGAGTKVWQSQNGRHSFGAGVSAGRNFGRHDGRAWRSKPSYGAGASYTFKFGK